MKFAPTCGCCRAAIPQGSTYVSINFHVESTDRLTIDVHEAVMCAVWCRSCAPATAVVENAVRALTCSPVTSDHEEAR